VDKQSRLKGEIKGAFCPSRFPHQALQDAFIITNMVRSLLKHQKILGE